MIKNYFKIAWRNLMKNKTFSFINIFGLAVGFTCCLLISGFLYDELSYDKSPADAADIYRVELNFGNKDFYSAVDNGVGQGMKNVYPEITGFTRASKWGNVFVKYGTSQFKETSLAFADSNFLEFFSIPLAKGDVHSALKEPGNVVISDEMAKKYFGNEDPVGKTLVINNDPKILYKVTGVTAKNIPNLHFKFDFYVNFPFRGPQTWSNIGVYTYLKLRHGTDPRKLESRFPELVAKYVVPEVQHDMGVSLAEAQKSVNNFIFYLKPIEKIHLYSANKDELQPNGSIRYVYIFAALALFILLLAAVNFTNLSTATSIRRSKEVGIRKVMGSEKKQLMAQFLSESVLLALLSFFVSLLFVYLLLPYFNNLAGKHVLFSSFISYKAIIPELMLVAVTGFFAGIYPAFFLSSFSIISILKGKNKVSSQGNKSLRSGLVVFQFAVSISLIICTIVVYRQLHFMQNKELGFDKSQVLIINDTYLLGNDQQAFKDQLLQNSMVESASLSRDVPIAAPWVDGTQAYAPNEKNPGSHDEIHINKYHVDYDYIKTLGIQLINGRNFSDSYPSDSAAVVVNETAVKDFQIKGDPLGKKIICSGQAEYTIIGVVKDFHYMPIKEKIAPLVMMLGNNMGGIMVRVKARDIKPLIAGMKSQWESYHASGPFAYNFADDKFAAVYASEERTGKIFSFFALLSVIIASLGLFGLSAFSTAQRTKEIGVRKVLGANISQIVMMLSKEFLIMVLIAFVIAIPVTWVAMHQWLEDFAYRVNINWSTFIVSGILALLVAFATVSFQALKAALANPVKSLRTE